MAGSAAHTLHFDAFHLAKDVDLLYRGKDVVPLEPRAVGVLRYLVEQNDRVISKEELLENVWPGVFTTDGVLKKAVSQIRRTLGDEVDQARFIATHHGRGYRFIAQVTRGGIAAKTEPGVAAHRSGELSPMYDQFAGRESELAALRGEYLSTVQGTPRGVIVIGEAGIGKTHLLRQFRRWAIDQGAISLNGRFFDYRGGRLAPYELFLDLIAEATSSGSARLTGQELRNAVEAQCGVRLPGDLFRENEEWAEAPATMGAGRAGDQFRFVVPITRALLALARRHPMLIVLDDLQWADQASLDLLGCLMRSLGSEPLMLVALIRSDEADGRDHPVHEWLTENAVSRSYTTIRLRRLDADVCRGIVGSMFGMRDTDDIPPGDLASILRVTDGNPYFLIETLRLLVTANAVVADPETARWQWRGFHAVPLPETITNAARAKLEGISDDLRELIEEAGVLGDEFRVVTLCAMTGRSEPETESLLSEGVRAAILSIHGLSPGEDCRFQHTLLRQVVYDSIAPQRKRRLHARAATAIETIYVSELDRMAEALSAHHSAAGQNRPAFEASLHAWRIAAARSEWLKALVLIERAGAAEADLLKSQQRLGERERLELLAATGETWCALGRIREAAAVLDDALTLAALVSDPAILARLLGIRGQTAVALSSYDEARSFAARALELFRELQDDHGRRRTLVQLASIEAAVGNYDGADHFAAEALAGCSSDEIAAHAFSLIGWSLALQGRSDEGKTLLGRSLELLDASGNLRQRSVVLRRMHWIELSCGRYESAIDLALRARADSVMIGDVNGQAKANMGIGQARIAQGLFDEGISFLDRAFERLQVIGDAHCEAETLWLLARAHCESSRVNEARSILNRALAMIRKIGDRDDEFRMMIDLARLDLAGGELEKARANARLAASIAESLSNDEGAALAMVEEARVDLAGGSPRRAIDLATRASGVLDGRASGERWRSHLVLGLAHDLAGDPAAARTGLETAVILLGAIRDELPIDDQPRRLMISRNRSSPARELARLLTNEGHMAEAAVVRQDWMLDELDP